MAQTLWYTRQAGKAQAPIRGPYPAPVVAQYLTLGRLTPEDEVSLDGQAWFSIRASGHFQSTLEALAREAEAPVGDRADWHREREQARRRWLDERLGVDALPGEAPEHRGGEPAAQVALREDHQHTQDLVIQARRMRPAVWGGVAVALVIGAVALVLALGEPDEPLRVPSLAGVSDCAAPPAPGVVWRGCDKRNLALPRATLRNAQLAQARLDGANLRGGDLAYASLARASLRGTDLTGADLTGADLGGADFSGANLDGAKLDYATLTGARLEGARLEGTRLGKAVWTDGRPCAAGSVGGCGPGG